jgi:23S rRNA (uracil1939-C5)-methyltransferase
MKNITGNPGSVFSLRIESLAAEGLGVGHWQGRAVFVPFSIPGEKIGVRLTKSTGRRLLAEPLEIEEASVWRRQPPCPVFGRCGGCSLQHIRDEKQLELKQTILFDALRTIAGLEQQKLPPAFFFASPLSFGYRNRGQYPVAEENKKIISGFFARASHRVIAVEKCLIHHETIDQAVRQVRAWAGHKKISIYNENIHKGWLRHITARVNSSGEALLVTLVATSPGKMAISDLLRRLRREVPQLVGLACNIQPARTNVIFGKKTFHFWGESNLPERFLGLKLQLAPTSFFQVNHAVAEELFSRAVEFLSAVPGPVVDAFCGVGLGALLCSREGKEAIGIDKDGEAIESARRAARENGLVGATFYIGAVERVLPRITASGLKPRAAVIDPPRSGCRPEVLNTLGDSPIERLAYISCNPGTLARDLKLLLGYGFSINKIFVMDMFPQSEHLETLVCLER